MSALMPLASHLAPLMCVALILLLLIGYPVAFSLGALGLAFYALGVVLAPYSAGQIHLDWSLLLTVPERIFSIMTNETLLAIPFFTFLGLVLERSGMAEDLLDTFGELCGGLRGGLAYAVIFVGTLLAATTGVVAASVIAMGLIALPLMLRTGYDRALSCGVIAASGTLAQIMPPALVLIVLADQMHIAVSDIYRAAVVPALLLAALFSLFIACVACWRPDLMPARPAPHDSAPAQGKMLLGLVLLALWQGSISLWVLTTFEITASFESACIWACGLTIAGLCLAALWDQRRATPLLAPLVHRVILVMTPPLALIFIVLGSIIIGLATPSEAGALGACGALMLAALKKRVSRAMLADVLERSVRLTSFALFILIGARIFSLTFFALGGQDDIAHLFSHLPYGTLGFLLIINLALFILAFFLEFFELAFIIIPLIVPTAQHLGIDLVWLGIIIALNVQTSFMHPPFGYSLFYLRSVAPIAPYRDAATGALIAPVTTAQIYLGAIPFVLLQLLMVGIVILWPSLLSVPQNAGARPASQIEDVLDALPSAPRPAFTP